MGRHRKIDTPKALEKAWEEYKKYCDTRKVKVHGFSAKNNQFVTEEVEKATTYTIEGFCVWARLSRSAFYANYAGKEPFADIVAYMREECEVDAHDKFELGMIPTQLSGLWMSKYGYTTKPKEQEPGEKETGVVMIPEVAELPPPVEIEEENGA